MATDGMRSITERKYLSEYAMQTGTWSHFVTLHPSGSSSISLYAYIRLIMHQ